MANVHMNPNAERDIARLLVAKANEAVAAVGPADHRSSAEIAAQLREQLVQRGLEFNASLIDDAAAEIAAGKLFEFR